MIRTFVLLFITIFTCPLPAVAVDVVLTLDRSLSMKGNDPDRESLKGAELFGQLLNAQDRLALTSFAQNSESLMPLTAVTDSDVQKKFSTLVQQLQMSGVRTNFESALRVAYQIYQDQATATTADKVLILFSDGQLNLGTEEANQAAKTAIFNDIIPKFQGAGIRILGVAFSPEADLEFLSQLAEATGGQSFRAEKPTDIYDAFVRLFEQTDQPLTAPIINGEVSVDKNVKELSLLVKRDAGDAPMQLTTPTGRQIDINAKEKGVDWKRSTDFDHVSIQQPEVGTWKVSADNDRKKAYIQSELDLKLTLPALARFSDTIIVTARLMYQGASINPEIIKNTRFIATVFDVNGNKIEELELTASSIDLSAQDHRGILNFQQPGPFEVQVTAINPEFQRQKNRFITLVQQVNAGLTPAALLGQTDHATIESPVVFNPAADEAARQSAIFILIASNLGILAIIGIGVGIWWWRRPHSVKNDGDDFDSVD